VAALMLGWRRPLALVNARVVAEGGPYRSLRVASRVLDIGAAPRRGDAVIDLGGACVLPGLINGHDHLELNHYGALKRRECYQNVSEWIDDLRPLIRHDPSVRIQRGRRLADRLFIGGLKNLLAGVTTVAHHNPRYAEFGRHFPVRLVERYGWAHSLAMEREPVGAKGEPGGSVRQRCDATPASAPFVVHVGEGIDARAEAEVARFVALTCLRPNSVIVHGVALTPASWSALVAAGSSLVWCPASNAFLFGRTLPLRACLDATPGALAQVCLGTDSRLTGSRDLLDELRTAARIETVTPGELLAMVTTSAARALKLEAAGRLVVGRPADLMVIPPPCSNSASVADALLETERRDVRLVMIGGRPMIAAPNLAAVFAARHSRPRALRVDGVERLADRSLVAAIARCPIREPGVEAR
jgi:cytosine/adenosine deaminase-related metal-dependent hydrolase